MQKDKALIKKILEAIEAKVDSEWKDDTTKLQGKFGKVSDTGTHEMKDATANYDSVKGGTAAKKMETKPGFSKVTKGAGEGGATGVDGQGKPKEVKLTETEEALEEGIENLEEISTNVKKLTDRNPAINENDAIKKIEESLSPENRLKAQKLREAIEKITGKKVVYK